MEITTHEQRTAIALHARPPQPAFSSSANSRSVPQHRKHGVDIIAGGERVTAEEQNRGTANRVPSVRDAATPVTSVRRAAAATPVSASLSTLNICRAFREPRDLETPLVICGPLIVNPPP